MEEYGPQTAFGQAVFAQKYAEPGETYRGMVNRVANALSDGELHFRALRGILGTQRFLPAGRILAAIGTSKEVCAHNCFVSGTIEDSYVEGDGSIMQRATEAAATMRMGGGIGYDFSTLRPRGATIKKLASTSTGPVSFMEIFNAVGLATCSAGHRRGAQMGILRCDHPDILEFVRAKQNPHALTGFNISVAVTDELMECVANDEDFQLRFEGQVYSTIKARDLWDEIMRSAWDWAEPGVVFIDKMNEENNLAYCETIAATNPCSEQPLPPFGACLLGSFNLTKYVKPGGGTKQNWTFDLEEFRHDIPHVVRAMDNVNDAARYPLPAQRDEALDKRRMGLGVTGLANALEACGFAYGSEGFVLWTDIILGVLKNEAYRASAQLAAEKGWFPLFHTDQYLASPYIQRLDSDVISAIRKNGIRNSHLISMAPTGTISLIADNVSSGIEPVFAERYTNKMYFAGVQHTYEVVDYGLHAFGVNPRTTADVTVEEHLRVLCMAQTHTDSAVSKTCNVTAAVGWEGFKDIYAKAWARGAKGCSVFNIDGKRMGVLQVVEEKPEPTLDPSCISGLCER